MPKSRTICVALFIRFKSTIDLWFFLNVHWEKGIRSDELTAESNKEVQLQRDAQQLNWLIRAKMDATWIVRTRIFFFFFMYHINFVCSINSTDRFSQCAANVLSIIFFSANRCTIFSHVLIYSQPMNDDWLLMRTAKAIQLSIPSPVKYISRFAKKSVERFKSTNCRKSKAYTRLIILLSGITIWILFQKNDKYDRCL